MNSDLPTTTDSIKSRAAAAQHQLLVIKEHLENPDVTEICINRPGEVFIETNAGWSQVICPAVDSVWCQRFPTVVATFSNQKVGEANPMLSASLPHGERIEIAVPPIVERGRTAITIRKPSLTVVTRAQYEASGFTSEVSKAGAALAGNDAKLLNLYNEGAYWDFFEAAVLAKKNIVISGATGSGKTTFAKTIVGFIPTHERIVTIEDVREMFLPQHPNRVHLLYSQSNQATSNVSAKSLLQASLRMKPDRILLAEIRSKVAYDYIVNVSSGHPGSITTVHADSAAEAYEMLMLRVKESEEGREMSRLDILNMLRSKIDIVIQVKVLLRPDAMGQLKKIRRITEIHYDPAYRHQTVA